MYYSGITRIIGVLKLKLNLVFTHWKE